MARVLREYASARQFLRAHARVLARREGEYNLKIGLAHQIAVGELLAQDARFYSIEDDSGASVGQAMQTASDRPLILSHMDADASSVLAGRLAARGAPLRTVVGPRAAVSRFAEIWEREAGQAADVVMEQLCYEARSVRFPERPSLGAMARATSADRQLTLRWIAAFIRECFPSEPPDPRGHDALLERLITSGLLLLWRTEDGQAVAMAARNRESPHGATVSYVYTPPEHRGRGYASCLVAHLSRSILESGKSFCCLFADARNPSSNRIYQRIGYEVVGEAAHYAFGPRR